MIDLALKTLSPRLWRRNHRLETDASCWRSPSLRRLQPHGPCPVLSECRAQASGGLPPRGRESFFERLHGIGVLPVGLGSGADMREAQVLQGTVDRIVRDRDAKLLVEPHD